MSYRPSKNLQTTTCPSKDTEYAVIGDTVSSTMYILKLIREGVSKKIHHITTGSDKISDNTESTDFIPNNTKTILHYLQNTKIHYVASENCNAICPPNTCSCDCGNQTDLSHYHTNKDVFFTSGSGPLGDIISSSIIPRIGPWFSQTTSSSKIQRYVDRFSTLSRLNPNEQTIACRLSELWNIPITDSVNTSSPAILGRHYTLKKKDGTKTIRQLFKAEYETMLSQSNVVSHNEQESIYFDPSTTEGNWNISSRNLNIPNVKVSFKTNPYNWIKLATKGEMEPNPIKIPVFYRAVIPILKSGGVSVGTRQTNGELSNPNYIPISVGSSSNPSGCGCNSTSSTSSCSSSGHEDYIHTHNTFSLHNFKNNKQSNLSWLGHTYLATEDYFPTDQKGWFASELYNLLIVESISLENRRDASYHTPHQEIHINYNKKTVEENYLKVFARIVSDIILTHTGTRITPESLLAETHLCVTHGTCFDFHLIENYSHRESPLTTILEMITGIFNTNHYTDYEGQN